MAVERYEVGRKYTKRVHTKVALSDLEGMHELMEELASSDLTVAPRLADLEARAAAVPQSDQEQERESLGWYAGQILAAIAMLRRQIELGKIELAVDLALEIGVLATEAKMIQYHAGNTRRGGEGFKTSDVYLDVKKQHDQIRDRARELWTENPKRNQITVATKIDPDPKKRRNIIRVISDLDPRKKK